MSDDPRTFAFIDLAGFTALTDAHGDETAAELASRFVSVARNALSEDVALVKAVGDAVMLTAPSPRSCLETVIRTLEHCADEPDFPSVRGGLASGGGAERDGDWFGTAVNLAARLCAEAPARRIYLDAAVAEVARDAGHAPHQLGQLRLRGLARSVDVWSLDTASGSGPQAVDPVCRMLCDPQASAAAINFGGVTWYFCSVQCAHSFSGDPEAFVTGTKDDLGAGEK